MDEQNRSQAMGWDDSIENDSQQYPVVPEGDYNFTVTGFERGRFPGSAKLEACNKASLTLEVETKDGPVTVFTDLILNRKLEWKLSEFFRSIGMKKKGERVVMDWSKVQGAHGRAHFKPRKYTASDGTERTASNVEHFLDYDPKNFHEDEWMSIPEESQEELPFN